MGEGPIAHPKSVGRTPRIASFSGTLVHSPREATSSRKKQPGVSDVNASTSRQWRNTMLTMKSVRTAQHVSAWLRATTLAAAVSALVLAVLAIPASARGTAQISGIGAFNNTCQPPVGSPPDNLGDYPPIEL